MIWSDRFNREVRVTSHAQERGLERNVSMETIMTVLETGTVKSKDEERAWIFKDCSGRNDNPVCLAVSLERKVIVKTVMVHWTLTED